MSNETIKSASTYFLFTAILGGFFHAGLLFLVFQAGTAGFAVSLRNAGVVSAETAHVLGLAIHLAGMVISLLVGIGALSIRKRPGRTKGVILAIGVSLPAISPFFGLAFPLGIWALVKFLRYNEKEL